jgi:hypothetical protein
MQRKEFYKSKRRSVRQMNAWGMAPHKPTKASSLLAWRYERQLARVARTLVRRNTVGYIRAFVGPHYFAGCYAGAEND